MSPGRDDDALTWDGDEDPTLDVGSGAKTSDPAPEETTDAAAPAGSDTVVLPAGYTPVGKGSEQVRSTADAAVSATDPGYASPEDGDASPGGGDASPGGGESVEDDGGRGMSSAALVGIGILAGVYLLLSIGWLLGAARFQLVAALFLEPVAFQITLWLAVLALPLWFVTVFWLTRGGRAWLRFVLLVAGAVLLIPWPFVLAGAAL